MDRAAVAVENAIEAEHWWFRGRRRLLAREILACLPDRSARILEVGCGTGGNLRVLKAMGYRRVIGCDLGVDAPGFIRDKGLAEPVRGDGCQLPFADGTFDLVLAADIVEHVVDDDRITGELRRVLRPGAPLIVLVPTFPALWGLQDEVSHHQRRYLMAGLRRLVRDAGLAIERSFYFNFLLFLPIWAARRLIDLLGIKLDSENQVNSPLINRVLTALFRFDVGVAGGWRPPFGVSALVRARRPR